jgi:hypothetical protein
MKSDALLLSTARVAGMRGRWVVGGFAGQQTSTTCPQILMPLEGKDLRCTPKHGKLYCPYLATPSPQVAVIAEGVVCHRRLHPTAPHRRATSTAAPHPQRCRTLRASTTAPEAHLHMRTWQGMCPARRGCPASSAASACPRCARTRPQHPVLWHQRQQPLLCTLLHWCCTWGCPPHPVRQHKGRMP